MGWVDYKNAYDMVPHSWIREVLEDMKTSRNVVKADIKQHGEVENKTRM